MTAASRSSSSCRSRMRADRARSGAPLSAPCLHVHGAPPSSGHLRRAPRRSLIGDRRTAAPIASQHAVRGLFETARVGLGAAPGRGRGARAGARPGPGASRSPTALDPEERGVLDRQSLPSRSPLLRLRVDRCTRCRGRSRCSQRSPKDFACTLSLFGTATATIPPGTTKARRVLDRPDVDRAGARASARRSTAAHSPVTSATDRSRKSSRNPGFARYPWSRGRGGGACRRGCRPPLRRRAPGPAEPGRRCVPPAAHVSGRGCPSKPRKNLRPVFGRYQSP